MATRLSEGPLKLVFPTEVGTVQFLANIWTRAFAPAQVKAGVVNENGKAKYGFHSLRHFFASWIIEQGFSAKRAQVLLGHSSIGMTLDTYTHIFPNEEDDAQKFALGAAAILPITGTRAQLN